MIITIKGIPIPKARARITRRGNISIAYDPQEKEKQNFKLLLSNELQNLFDTGDDAVLKELEKISSAEALSLDIQSYMPLRKSLSKTKRMQKKDNYHNVKPDGSNLFKFIEDSAIGILYNDDALIVKGSFMKIYSDDPRTVINIQTVDLKLLQ